MLTPKMGRKAICLVRRWMVGSSAVALAACGPLRARMPEPDPPLAAAADAAATTVNEVREKGGFPTAAVLADRTVLYTEILQDPEQILESGDGERVRPAEPWTIRRGRRVELHRDTIRGAAAVLRWLERRRDRGGDEVPFSLRSHRIYQCDGVVLQYGRYDVPRRDARTMNEARTRNSEASWVPFAVRWRAPEDGPIQMEALWMGPLDQEVPPARLADNCTDTEEIVFARAYAQRRWAVEAAVGYTLQQGAPGVVQDAATERGWAGRLSDRAPYWGELGVFWRIHPGWQLGGLASYQAPGGVEYFLPPLYEATLNRTAVEAAGLVTASLGPLGLGVGPAVSYTRWKWSDSDVDQPSTSTISVLAGGLAEVGYVQTFQSRVYLHLRARYGFFPDAETPGFRDLDPVAVPMSGGRVSAGVGYWW